eukprot:TRINITY_DN11416_c4_g9_i2.p1 TRINITY_DN11416_c4_g9~~TRINITY_DN11416_c4_g9_i2.p1  ORF type:complete len:137 (+),score=9.97 TRINITY_DN11416_c4_g9_i2:63-473(+)
MSQNEPLKTSIWLGRPLEEHRLKPELYRFADNDARQAHLALLTYVDLAESKNWLDMDVVHSANMKLTFIVGREGPARPKELVVPHAADRPLKLDLISSIFDSVADPDNGERLTRWDCVVQNVYASCMVCVRICQHL